MARRRATETAGAVEGPWALPEGWRWERLGSVVDIQKQKESPSPDSDLVFIGMESILPNSLRLNSTTKFREMKTPSSRFSKGDILYGRLRPYLNKVWLSDRSGVCSGEFFVLRARDSIVPAYVRYSLHSSRCVNYARHAVTGDRPRIDYDTLSKFPIPFPERPVQNALVERIDALFSEIDEGEAALARAREGLETYRRSLLKAAVTGELTAAWRAAHPARESGAQLLARILADRRAAWRADPAHKGKTYKEPAAPDTAGLPELPEGWVWTSLGQLFEIFIGATPPRSDPAMWGGEIPWVSSGEVNFCRIDATRECITKAALKGNTERVHPPGTVMLGMIGEGKTRGQVAILDVPAAHNQNCASIRVSASPIPPEYIYYFLEERYEQTRAASSGGNQPALNKDRVQAIRIPLPPSEEIDAIVDMISEQYKSMSLSLEVLNGSGGTTTTLRQSILAAAFRGDLAR